MNLILLNIIALYETAYAEKYLNTVQHQRVFDTNPESYDSDSAIAIWARPGNIIIDNYILTYLVIVIARDFPLNLT